MGGTLVGRRGLRARSYLRAALAVFAGAAALCAASSNAHASAGCNSVNAGGFNRTKVGPGAEFATVNGFAVGDVITFTVTVTNHTHPTTALQWWIDRVPGGVLLEDHSSYSDEVYTRTYTVGAGVTNIEQVLRNQHGAAVLETMSVTATCTPGVPSGSGSGGGTPQDSLKLRAVQTAGSNVVAQMSGAAIGGGIDNAVNSAFGGGGAPVTIGPSGMTFNFTAEPRAGALSGKAADAGPLAALGYAPAVNKAWPAAIEKRWSAWLSVQGTGFDRSDGLDGTQLNAIAGLGYKVTPNVLLGVTGGYETFNYDVASLTGNLSGDGYTVGGYAGWKLAPSLVWQAALGWTGLGYDASAGSANGSFSASRWLASTALTGSYRMSAAVILEPSASVFTLWEDQDAWTDSLGTVQASRSFSTGRVSAGGRVLAPVAYAGGYDITPFVGLYADWRFASDDAIPSGQPLVGIGNNWSGRATGGLNIASRGGASLGLTGEYGGIGADYSIWTASARLYCPF